MCTEISSLGKQCKSTNLEVTLSCIACSEKSRLEYQALRGQKSAQAGAVPVLLIS